MIHNHTSSVGVFHIPREMGISSTMSTPTSSLIPPSPESNHNEENLATVAFILPMSAAILFDFIVVFGNSLVIAAVFTHKRQLLTVTNTFIVSLAVADLMLGLVVLPFSSANEVLGRWPFGETWCTAWLVLDVWLCTASILNLCAISIDRYLAISYPFKYPTLMSPRNAKILVGFVWVLALAICVPPLFGWRGSESIIQNNTLHQEQINSSTLLHSTTPFTTRTTLRPNNSNPALELEWHLLGYSQGDYSNTEELRYKSLIDGESKTKMFSNVMAAKPQTIKNTEQELTTSSTPPVLKPETCALTNEPGYVIYSACGSFWIPMLVMLYFYVRIYRTASKATNALRRGVVTQRVMTSSNSIDSAVNLRVHRGGGANSTNGTGCRASTGSWLDGGEVLPSQRFRLQQLVAQTAPRSYSTTPTTPEPTSRNYLLSSHNDCSNNKRSSAFSKFFMRSVSRDSILSGSDVRGYSYSASHEGINGNENDNTLRINNCENYRASSLGCSTLCEEVPSNGSIEAQPPNTTSLTGRRTTGFVAGIGLLQVRTQLRRLNREKRAAKTVGIIVGCFILCWAPFFSVYLLGAFCPDCTPSTVFIIVFWLGYCNSAVNPFIYAMCSNDFRRAFHRLLLCRWGRRRRNRTQLSMLITGLRTQQSTIPPDRRISDLLSTL